MHTHLTKEYSSIQETVAQTSRFPSASVLINPNKIRQKTTYRFKLIFFHNVINYSASLPLGISHHHGTIYSAATSSSRSCLFLCLCQCT